MGPYPRTPLPPRADLAGGLETLAAAGFVSITLVPDPLAAPGEDALRAVFDLCRPFKTHVLVDRAAGPYAPSKHHRERIRRGRRRCRVELVSLGERLDDWRRLYAGLVARHAISGPARFPDRYFETLARMPDMVALAAFVDATLAAMTIWFEHDGVAVSHLTAANDLGYANGASFALNDAAIEHFAAADVIDLGGSAGAGDDHADGLFQFKRGFGNAETRAFLCGTALDPAGYKRLTARRCAGNYFPAYRG